MRLDTGFRDRFLTALVFAALTCVCWGPAHAGSTHLAQQSVNEGLEISKTMPNSDQEARCYIRALELDPEHASAHFNLAYVLDAQAMKHWRGRETAWEDVNKLYKALDHYAQSIRLDPSRSAACENVLRIAALVLDTPTKRPADLYALRTNLSICFEAAGRGGNRDVSCGQPAQILILKIEKQLDKLKGARPNRALLSAEQISSCLNRNFTRGASPYKGPRIPLTIHFEVNKATIRSESASQLREVALAIKGAQLANNIILIEGHADSQGPSAYNLELSKQRANSVKRYLVSFLGVSGRRIEIRAYGESRPLVPNDTRDHQAINRRVEFVNMDKLSNFQTKLNSRKRSGDVDPYDYLY